MNYIQRINEIHAMQITAAESIINSTPALSQLKGMHNLSLPSGKMTIDDKNAHSQIKEAVTKTVTKLIMEQTPPSQYELKYQKDLDKNIQYYSGVHYYIMLQLAGIQYDYASINGNENINFSKSISSHYLFKTPELKRFSKAIDNISDKWDFEKRVIDKIIDPIIRMDGDLPHTFYGLKTATKTNDVISAMSSNQELYPNELANYLYHICKNQVDGRSNNMNRKDVVEHGLACALAFINERNDICRYDINTLISQSHIEPVPLWETKYYHDHMAPSVSNEGIENVALSMMHNPQIEILNKLKEKLTDKEIFSTLLNTGRSHDQHEWQLAMNKFAIVTGKRLTFKESRDLQPSSSDSMLHTSVYFDYLDNEFNPDLITRDTSVSIHKEKSEDRNYEISIKNDALGFSVFSEHIIGILDKTFDNNISNYFVHENELTITGNICYPTDKKIMTIANKFKDLLDEFIAESPLPGDTVKIHFGDNAHPDSYPNLVDGESYTVTKIENGYNGTYYKLKGADEFIEGDIMILQSKHRPKNNPQSISLEL